jgi:hypothetical protein
MSKRKDDGAGISKQERKRRSRLPAEHENAILPTDPLYCVPSRHNSKRIGDNEVKLYRVYDVQIKDWVTFDPEKHDSKNKMEESGLFKYVRENRNKADNTVDENYNTGSSAARALHQLLNKPKSTGVANSNNKEWACYEKFCVTTFPNTAETKQIRSWEANELRNEPPFNNEVFPFIFNLAIARMYLELMVTPKFTDDGERHEGLEINHKLYLPRGVKLSCVKNFCGAYNNVHRACFRGEGGVAFQIDNNTNIRNPNQYRFFCRSAVS